MKLTSALSIYGLILQIVQNTINITPDLYRESFLLRLFVEMNYL
ncbi:hypothetical protein VRK_05680 [Vibrio sp. MEBiC08052]|nr:hypothetical protein VRK_05680 [Vibrio sp. MEBiC08052]